jgi:hypothetical protein
MFMEEYFVFKAKKLNKNVFSTTFTVLYGVCTRLIIFETAESTENAE